MEILIVVGGMVGLMVGTLVPFIIIGYKKGMLGGDKTVYHCNYCNATAHIFVYPISGLNICQECKKKAFDRILQ